MKNDLIMAVNQICAEKDLPRDVIMGAIEEALAHAYRRNYANNSAAVTATIDPITGDMTIVCEKKVVETVLDPSAEIALPDALKLDRNAEIGGTFRDERQPADFGRIAAQTAKQVILQRIHEAERDAVYDFYHQKEGELITGTVQSVDYRSNAVTITLSKKAEGTLAAEDQLPNDRYRIGQSVRCLLAEVNKGTRGPQIRLSRTHRNMLRRLLEREIPEIYNGTVEVKSIAREPGQRSKVAVAASQPGVDPVGSCVGLRGTRIQNIVDELNGEKIDVVEWNSEVRNFISNALSPARPSDTVLIEDGDVRTAIVVVPDRQLSLAIGKEGQNARLAAKLTGWRIDIKSETEAATEGLSELKRQQLQAMKQRSLEAKVAALPPGDDLLSRAEWLLREKDKTAVTLEQAAKMLADAEAATSQAEIEIETPAPVAEAAPEAEAALPEAAETAETPAVVAEAVAAEPIAEVAPPVEGILEVGEAPEYVYEEVVEEEDQGEGGDKKPAKKSKKTTKKRELVFDESLGQVIARKKRKPGRGGGWEEFTDY
jgi:transcription termination/antitermination protein NusA